MSSLEELDDTRAGIWSTSPGGEADPSRAALPVRWTPQEGSVGTIPSTARDGGEHEQMSVGDDHLMDVADDGPEPDAIARGWVVPPGGSRVDAIFVLSGTSLGIGRIERVTPPVWLNLDELVQLDAIGDPVDGLTEVEIVMEDRRAIGAGWTDDFCDAVVRALRTGSGRPETPAEPPSEQAPAPAPPEVPAPGSFAAPAPGPSSPPAPGSLSQPAPEPLSAPAPAPPAAPAPAIFAEPAPAIFGAPAPAPAPSPSPVPSPFAAEPAPAPAPDAATSSDPGYAPTGPSPAGVDAALAPVAASTAPTASLELEDVVYLGGYPGQSKRRKKCVVTMGRTGLELAGPGGLGFRVGWDAVRTVEVQNSDEARFRMNTKVHRDASALVVECEQGVTILLEARDCPTIALRSAIAQLLAGLPVLVV